MVRNPELTLMAFMGMDLVQQVAKRKLFGGPYLHFADYVMVSGYLYQSGALIAQAILDKLIVFASMIAEPGREEDVLDWVQSLAKKRFDDFVHTYGEQPKSLSILFLATEYEKAGITIPFNGIQMLTDTHMKQVTKVASSKMSVKDVEPNIKNVFLEGVGFGGAFPELTEQMYRSGSEDIDAAKWSEARKHGLNISETPTIITFEEQQNLVLSHVATYVQAYFPELVDPLGLNELISQQHKD